MRTRSRGPALSPEAIVALLRERQVEGGAPEETAVEIQTFAVAVSEPETVAVTEPVAEAEVEVETDAEAVAEAKVETEAEAEVRTDAEAVAEANVETEAEPEIEAEAEAEVEEAEAVPEPEAEPEPEPELTPKPLDSQEVSVTVEKSQEAPHELSQVWGMKALEIVCNAENSSWLAASPLLVQSTRAASEFLFSVLAAYTENSPLEKLLTEGFDAEQIWQQIDLQANPTLTSIKKLLRKVERTPVQQLFPVKTESLTKKNGRKKRSHEEEDFEDFENGESGSGDEDPEEDEAEQEEGFKSDNEEFSDYDEEDKKVVEDKFLRLNEMEKFLDRADAEDAGIAPDGSDVDEDDDAEVNSVEGEDDIEEDLEMEDAFNFSAQLTDKGQKDNTWGPKYSEFVGKGKSQKQKPHQKVGTELSEGGDELEDEDDEGERDSEDDEDPVPTAIETTVNSMEDMTLSAHEKRQEKVKRRIEQLEKANLDPKSWTLQGEVTASRRPKNSALEVELDFEHGARPAPVITEEVTQSLEDVIRARIIESRYDDPQPKAAPRSAAPKDRVELDEEKSKRGLGEIYEQDYMENTGLAQAATPAVEALKTEATVLFKNLCNRLDALSHFHFAPKPAVEEMGVRVNVPALAMEENKIQNHRAQARENFVIVAHEIKLRVAPLAISDASMLAPEEVYKSAGIVKGEGELTPEERKRRRAQKKRKRKGAKKAEENIKKMRLGNAPPKDPLKEMNVRLISNKDRRATSSFGKSAKVFAELDKGQEKGSRKAAKQDDKPSFTPSFLKL